MLLKKTLSVNMKIQDPIFICIPNTHRYNLPYASEPQVLLNKDKKNALTIFQAQTSNNRRQPLAILWS